MSRRGEKEIGSGIARQVRGFKELATDKYHDGTELLAWFTDGEEKRTRTWGLHAETISAIRAEMNTLRKSFDGMKPGSSEFEVTLKNYNRQFKERDTEAWYIQEIEVLAKLVEVCLKAGRNWEAVSRAIQIGDLLAEVRIKFLWDEHATFGKMTRTNLSQGQANRRRSSRDARFKHVTSLMEQGHTLSSACRIAAPAHRVKPETLEKDYQRIKKESTSARMLRGSADT